MIGLEDTLEGFQPFGILDKLNSKGQAASLSCHLKVVDVL